ncbi:MAG: HupE/UreJ family protein [Pseudomonadota bacterium]
MKIPTSGLVLPASLLASSPAAWAHPALFDGSLLANLAHLLTQPDHLLLLGGVGLVAWVVMHTTKKSNSRGNDDGNQQ